MKKRETKDSPFCSLGIEGHRCSWTCAAVDRKIYVAGLFGQVLSGQRSLLQYDIDRVEWTRSPLPPATATEYAVFNGTFLATDRHFKVVHSLQGDRWRERVLPPTQGWGNAAPVHVAFFGLELIRSTAAVIG